MRTNRAREPKQVYARILITIIASIASTLLVASTILYMNFENIALKQVYRSDSASLAQTSREVAQMTETAKSLSFQIYQDAAIQKLLFYAKPNIYDVTLAMSQLDNYRRAMPYIESIYVYNAKSEDFYISSSNYTRNGVQPKEKMDDEGIMPIFKDYQHYKPFLPIPRTYKIGSSDKTQVSSYSYLCYDSILDSNLLNTAVVVNIFESWINKDIGGSESDAAGGKTFIVNQSGMSLSANGKDPMLTDFSESGYMKEILNNSSSSGYFVDDVDGMKSLVSYTAPDTLGWRYVRTTPYDSITREITKMRYNTLYIILGILISGLLTAVIMSLRLYRPIDKVIRKMKSLEAERRDSLYTIRQEFLRNLIQGRETYPQEVLQKKLSYHGSMIEVSNKSRMVLIKIDRFQAFLETYGDDIKLIKYAIMNICSEICSESYVTESVDIGEDSILILLNFHESMAEADSESLLSMLQTMQASIMNHLKLSVSITVGPEKASADQSIRSFHQVMEASLHRLFKGHGCILFAEQIMQMNSREYEFPVQKEKQLVDCIMTGKSEEANRIYAEIINETAEYPYLVAQLAVSQLTLTINRVLNTIKKNNALDIELERASTLLSLNQVETIEEINTQFAGLIDQIGKKLEEKKSTKHEVIIKKINEIIVRDFSDSNLCLQSIADELDMSPIYVSRIYKQHSMNALGDVIQDVRMNESKQLLLHSNYSVAEIAEKTGFTSKSYFYRMFKKYYGVTPNDFRKKSVEASS
ncbi:helix-turn-helix domain-containing protein [Paenibacillus sp. GCM10027628]|uniref:helix-turn-helix domain-containing protein n=1 Tax=Paenibacillus sp. GCM10027628 TaxID=3273413 RepID=UPI0036453B4C